MNKATNDQHRNTSFIPGHLSSPIYDTECEFLTSGVKIRKPCLRHQSIKKFMKENGYKERISEVSQDPIRCIQGWAQIHGTVGGLGQGQLIDCLSGWIIQKVNFLEPMINGGSLKEDDIIRSCQEVVSGLKGRREELQQAFTDMKKVESIKDAICFKEIEMGQFLTKFGCHFERDVCLIQCCCGKVIVPTTLLLCALDKLQSRYFLLLYWILCDITKKYEQYSIYDRGSDLIAIFEPLRSSMGQDFYSLVAGWESFLIGWIVNDPEDSGCHMLYTHQRRELQVLLDKHHIAIDLDSILPSSRTTFEVTMHLELIGITKIFGYPTLDDKELLTPLRNFGVYDKYEIRQDIIEDVSAVMKRDFCINYRSKRGHYPAIKTSPPELDKVFRKNGEFGRSLLKRLDLWVRVEFTKTFNFDYCPDQTELLKDSAVAVGLEGWPAMYDRCAFEYRYDKPPIRVEGRHSTRTIDAFLIADEDDTRRLIEDLEYGRPDEDNHMAVQCGKECEMKPLAGRAFTKQTYDQRLIQTLLEHGVAESVFPFVPEQTMVDGEIRGIHRVLDQVKNMEGKSEFLCLDLRKWCLFQRHLSTSFAGKMYDQLFGLNKVYEYSHYYFIDCNIFCSSRMCPPDYDDNEQPIEGPYFMNKFRGGFEGLHQKKWTHIVISAIKLAAERTGTTISQMGQGDNQVIIIHYTKDEFRHRKEIFSKFYAMLDLILKGMNHELKEQETWHSFNLHEYSKSRTYKGVFASRATQKASKIVPDINDGLFSIPSSCSTLNTITESIAKHDYTSDRAFIINQLAMANYLSRKGIAHTSAEAMALMMWPSDFGGMPMSTYFAHTVRGHDDKVTLWISIIRTAMRINRRIGIQAFRLWTVSPPDTPTSVEERTRVYEDIYSLNVPPLPSAETDIKELTLLYLKSDDVTNPYIKRLYEEDVSMDKLTLLEHLDKMEPQFIQLSSELLKNSNAGLLIQMQKRFTGQKTIERVVNRYTEVSLISLVREKNEELGRRVQVRLLRREFSHEVGEKVLVDECPLLTAERLRGESWGLNFIELTKGPIQHQLVIKPQDKARVGDEKNAILIKVDFSAQENPKEAYWKFGAQKPYVGGSTHEKIKKPSIDITEKTSYAKAANTIGKVHSWVILAGRQNLPTLTMLLIDEKRDVVFTPEGTSLEDMSATIKSGNIFHRFMSSMEHSYAVINSLPGPPTHFILSSNGLAERTAGGVDISVFYQLVYVGSIAMMVLAGEINQDLAPAYLAVLECESCTHVLPNPDFDLPHSVGGYQSAPIVGRSSLVHYHAPGEDVKKVMEYDTAISVARGVDNKYKAEHAHQAYLEKTSAPRDVIISVNDLRQLDLERILQTMMIFSSHCQKLYKNRHTFLSCESDDHSFIPLAELLLSAGMVGHTFTIIGGMMTEHKMATTAVRLSAYLSRAIPSYLARYAPEAIKTALECVTREDIDRSMYRNGVLFACWLSIERGYPFNANLKVKMRKDIVESGYLRPYLRALGVSRTVSDIRSDNVVLLWRGICRDIPFYKPPRVNMQPMDKTSVFPQLAIMTFSLARGTGGGRTFDIPQISYAARSLGCISSAASKYIEIIYHLGLKREVFAHIYCLAEGSGGTVATLSAFFQGSLVHYNTLLRDDIDQRDDPTDSSAPAMVAIGLEERICPLSRISVGETNILRDDFLEKLDREMAVCHPDLLTMDAENETEGSNIDYYNALIPLILLHRPGMVILKMFLTFDFEELLRGRIPNTAGYTLVFMKPFCSNPVGREVFFIMISDTVVSRITEGTLDTCSRKWIEDKRAILSRQLLTLRDIGTYLTASCSLSSFFHQLANNDSLRVRHRYSEMMHDNQICSLFCYKYFDAVVEAIDVICHNETGMMAHLVVRMSSTNDVLHQLAKILFYLVSRMDNSRDALRTIERVEHWKVNDEHDSFRRRVGGIEMCTRDTPGSGAFFHDWSDSRLFLREEARVKKCGCRMPMRQWTRKMESDSYAVRLIKSWVDAGAFRGIALSRIKKSRTIKATLSHQVGSTSQFAPATGSDGGGAAALVAAVGRG